MSPSSTISPPPRYEEAAVQSSLAMPRIERPADPSFSDLFINRTGEHWMDGHAILTQRSLNHLRPWDHCIPLEELSKDNLPPFYVRLRDDQVGHLMRWIVQNRSTFSVVKSAQYWPGDFNVRCEILRARVGWGPAFAGPNRKGREICLDGGPKAPDCVALTLPPTNTSSGKIMCQEPDSRNESAASKRKSFQLDEDEERWDGKKARKDTHSSLNAKSNIFDSSNGKNPQDSEHSRDEVVQALIKKIDDLAGEKADMEAKLQEVQQEVKSSSEQNKRITTDQEETIRSQTYTIERLNARIKEADRQIQLTEQKYEKCNRTLTRVRKECDEHDKRETVLNTTKQQIEVHLGALRELTKKMGNVQSDHHKAQVVVGTGRSKADGKSSWNCNLSTDSLKVPWED